jgi:hypothetical protein
LLQTTSPLGQAQIPSWQIAPLLQAIPHPPQFAVLVSSLTQALLHAVSPPGHNAHFAFW